ncbi:MAG: hypothetical protein MRY83_14425 [Flavobacteriales bacterium]|nr:hypothetical protein [Flavobacteriales bacterium]
MIRFILPSILLIFILQGNQLLGQSLKKLKKTMPVIEPDHGKRYHIGSVYKNQETGDYEVEKTGWEKMDDHLYFNEKKWRKPKHKSLTKRKTKNKRFRLRIGFGKNKGDRIPEEPPVHNGEFE